MTFSQGWHYLKMIPVLHTHFLMRLSLSRILHLSPICSASFMASWFLLLMQHSTFLNKKRTFLKTQWWCTYHHLLGSSMVSLGRATEILCICSKTDCKSSSIPFCRYVQCLPADILEEFLADLSHRSHGCFGPQRTPLSPMPSTFPRTQIYIRHPEHTVSVCLTSRTRMKKIHSPTLMPHTPSLPSF